ncbi:metal-sulfur cluster biosynthetic enzyme [Corynebacterium resistens DSM 45100]|uniref:Metal-sulfur cluster biosynthetic enzyme n=1 Tax=Corynebacterium resistens (strain DSM 45100 / JCM 12819 / GTC 2026 / SICGH 158) TaxID=662755 RepID=F8E2K4_CORRG|nr:metal-sulfur cluster biosynthetic enzyme [Corynebacterium resistens DSM 45100]
MTTEDNTKTTGDVSAAPNSAAEDNPASSATVTDSAANPSAPEMDPSPLNDVPQPPANPTQEQVELAGKVEECLLDVIDPELGINVVDLGLVYDVWVEGTTAVVNMTLTSPACPLTDMLEDQSQSAVVGGVDEITELRLNWVWTPPWRPHMINEEGREQLRYLGFSV